MANDLVPINESGIQVLKEMEKDMSVGMMNQFFLQKVNKNGDPELFIKKAGLIWKLEQKYKNKYRVQSKLPDAETYNFMRMMLGVQEGQPCCIMEGLVYLEGHNEPFKAYGTATMSNCFNKNYMLEMAETRAILRAIRLATACGFTAVEEMPIEQTPEINHTSNNGNGNGKTPDKQLAYIHKLLKDLNLSKREDGLLYISGVMGRTINSTKDLTKEEKSMVIGCLEKDVKEHQATLEPPGRDEDYETASFTVAKEFA